MDTCFKYSGCPFGLMTAVTLMGCLISVIFYATESRCLNINQVSQCLIVDKRLEQHACAGGPGEHRTCTHAIYFITTQVNSKWYNYTMDTVQGSGAFCDNDPIYQIDSIHTCYLLVRDNSIKQQYGH